MMGPGHTCLMLSTSQWQDGAKPLQWEEMLRGDGVNPWREEGAHQKSVAVVEPDIHQRCRKGRQEEKTLASEIVEGFEVIRE